MTLKALEIKTSFEQIVKNLSINYDGCIDDIEKEALNYIIDNSDISIPEEYKQVIINFFEAGRLIKK